MWYYKLKHMMYHARYYGDFMLKITMFYVMIMMLFLLKNKMFHIMMPRDIVLRIVFKDNL
jgi:hypothetical protein